MLRCTRQLPTTKNYPASIVNMLRRETLASPLSRAPPAPDTTSSPVHFQGPVGRQPEHTSTHSYANSNSLFAVFAQPILTLQPNTGAIEPGLFSILFEQH